MYGDHHQQQLKNVEDLEISSYRGRELPPHGNVRIRPVDELIAEAHTRLLDAKAYFKPELPEGSADRDEKSKAPASPVAQSALAAAAAEPAAPTKIGKQAEKELKEKERELAAKKKKDFEAEQAARQAIEEERAAHMERDPKFKMMQEDLHANQGKAETADLTGMSVLERNAYIWRRQFYVSLKTLLGEILLHTTPKARLQHLDRVFSWYKSKERAPEDHVKDFPLPATITPGFHNFMDEDGLGFDPAQVPGSSFYEPPKGDDDEEEDEATVSATGRPKAGSMDKSGKVARPKGLPPARERLREFRTRQLIDGPFTARGDGSDSTLFGSGPSAKKLRDDSGSPERTWSPRDGAGTATPSTHVPFSARSVASSTTPFPSRPPTAMEFSRPGTAFDSSRPTTAMGSRPPTATSYGRGGTSYGDGGSSYGDGGPLQAWGIGAPRAPPGATSGATGGGVAKGRPVRRSVAEINMEQRWLARRHKEIADMEREDEERRALKAWSERKARTEEESLRNTEACRFSSVLQRREYVMPPNAGKDVMRGESAEQQESAEQEASSGGRRPGTAPPTRVDVSKPAPPTTAHSSGAAGSDGQDLHNQMLKQIRKMNAHLLHTIADDSMLESGTSIFDTDSTAKHISLSPYLQKGKQGAVRKATDETEVLQSTCTLWCNKHKQVPGSEESEEMGTVNLEGLRLKQLEEVEKIKRTFGHRNFPVNAQTLERALVMPQQKLKRGVDPCSLLPRLLINPFYESEFKKKTKQKKKKGRR